MAKGWNIDPSAFAGLVKEAVGKKLRIISIQLLNEVVMRSPVDTGRFRANNYVSVGAADFSKLSEADKTGTETLQRGCAVINATSPYAVVYIQNNLPYSEALEGGHSQQAPAGIYAVSFHGVVQAYK
ncbi:HK97 gp10 family phage protein [Pantoea osteomyelitidis]|uniref:HK97 gp10 family phage protein n=1 Tax=Pantoea osteomyelitidis TaxID=3230026 RepID=A0ABW7PVM2_9GAMM